MACARTVAVVVPSPAVSDVLLATSRTICAPMFSSGSLRSISLATVTPSFVMVGEPNFLSRTTLRPLGPSVTFTASASWFTPRRIAWREFSAYTICFAMDYFSPCRFRWGELAGLLAGRDGLRIEDAEHFVFTHDHELFAVELDFAAGIFAEE